MDDLFGLLDACRVTSRRSAGNGKRECSSAPTHSRGTRRSQPTSSGDERGGIRAVHSGGADAEISHLPPVLLDGVVLRWPDRPGRSRGRVQLLIGFHRGDHREARHRTPVVDAIVWNRTQVADPLLAREAAPVCDTGGIVRVQTKGGKYQ